MHRILIVEDDLTIASTLKDHLEKWQYQVSYIEDFDHIIESFISFDPQLVLLDIALPYFNGYHWCQEIRKLSAVPIVFISSSNDNMNIVMAMNMGGDDFISKPFDINVVVAKIQAIMRRTYSMNSQNNIIEHNGVILNLSDTKLHYGGEIIELTKNEFRILETLMENHGKVISRDDVIARLWESESFIDDNTLTVNVTRLRKKLETIGLKDYIKTKKGLGYVIE